MSGHHITGPNEHLAPGRWKTQSGSGSPSYGSTFYYPDSYTYSECWGHPTPNYYLLLKAGALIPPTVWAKTRMEGTCEGVYKKWRTTPYYLSEIEGFAGYRSWYPDFQSIFGAFFTEAKNFSATQKAASNIYGKGFDAGTFAAEALKSAKMVKSTAQKVTAFAKKYSSPSEVEGWLRYIGSPAGKAEVAKALKNPTALIGTIANAWLQGRFGWRPLVNDLENLNEVIIKFDEYKKRYSSMSGKQLSDNPSPSVTSTNEGEYTGTTTVSNSATCSMRSLVTADIVPSKYRMNLLSTAWELVPYSFVVDWLYDVGTAIEALSFLALASQYVASSGYRIECTQYSNYQSGSWIAGWTGDVNQTSIYKATFIHRRPDVVPFLPQTQFKINGLKCVDAIALVYQLFHRSKSLKQWNGKPLAFDLNEL